ncbi:hypothetical protein ACFYWY_17835 [Streptomyces sp. NPDC002870]
MNRNALGQVCPAPHSWLAGALLWVRRAGQKPEGGTPLGVGVPPSVRTA